MTFQIVLTGWLVIAIAYISYLMSYNRALRVGDVLFALFFPISAIFVAVLVSYIGFLNVLDVVIWRKK